MSVEGVKNWLVRWINFCCAGEREFAPIGCNALSKNGLAPLAILGRLPFANVENQDTRTAERPRKRVKHRYACVVIDEIIENAAAENAVVPRRR